MSDQQILSLTSHDEVLEKVAEPTTEKQPKSSDGSKARRQRRPKRKPESSEKTVDAQTKETKDDSAKNSPRDTSKVLIGHRPAAAYVNLVKNVLAQKHEVVTLEGVGKGGNSKVIQVANLLVKWSYTSISRIATKQPF